MSPLRKMTPLLCFWISLTIVPSMVVVADTAEFEVKKDHSHVSLDTMANDNGKQEGSANADFFKNNDTALLMESEEDDHMWDELYFGLDLGVPQTLYPDFEDKQVDRIQKARTYMEEQVRNDPELSSCQNIKEECSYYAVVGECERVVDFMKVNCAPMCELCHGFKDVNPLLAAENDPECPFDRNTNALKPGDLDEMFEDIISNPDFQKFEPKVLSRPTLAEGDTMETATYAVGGPWFLVFDKMTTIEEADRLVELGGLEGYERSLDVVDQKADGSFTPGVTSTRTSTNAWCLNECAADPMAMAVVDRMAKITGIPEENAENLQLLRYEEGQFYQVHHDYIPIQKDKTVGARILTFYIYLNDVEEGGGTNFPHIDVNNPDFTILPKKGRAVLWPSVLNMAPEMQDDRTLHQALPVVKGVKYGANAWVHMRNFKDNNNKGCA